MATEVGPQTRPTPKYETYVEQQIARARRRIRALDAAAIGLTLLLAALAYCLLVTFLDWALDLPAGARLAAFIVFALGAGLYLGVATFRLLSRRVNPYYAARQIEETLPDAKNSVVNWLDLRSANLPPAIRGALGQRAARDLKQADLDRAISTRRTTWLGTAALALFVVLLVWLVAGGGQAFSLLQRAFAPFKEVAIASRTEITLLQPEGGNVTVPLGRPVTFRVHVTGRMPRVNEPDALRLYYRYNPTDPYVGQNLEQDADGDWGTTLVADQVQGGLWYRIRGGDAETPEYQVRVRAPAQISGFDVKYHFRPYLHHPDQVVHYPNEHAVAPHLRAFRGTEVTVSARANRPVREGSVEMDQGGVKKEISTEIQPPDTMRFHFVLDRNGIYRVLFTGIDRDSNIDRSPYRIEVVADRAPLVSLNKPGKDVELPSNGTLSLEGKAEDDFGITKMLLRLQVKDGPVLKAKVYREGKSFRLDSGAYPNNLAYKDFVALEKVQTDASVPFALAPGMEVKYWLEARDNCDYPDKHGNVGKSKEYTVKIIEPAPNSQQQQDRKQAQQAQQQHEKRQDQKLDKQNEQSQQAQQDGAGNEQQKSSEQNQNPSQKEFENKANELAKAIEQKEKQEANKNQSKGDNSKAQGASKQNGQDDKSSNPNATKEKEQSGGTGKGAQKEANAEKGQDQKNQKAESSSGQQANDKKQPDLSKNQEQQPGKENGTNKQGQAGQEHNKKPGEGGTAKQDQAGQEQNGKQDQRGGAGNEKTQPQAGGTENSQPQAKNADKEKGPLSGDAQGAKKEQPAGNSAKGADGKSQPKEQTADAKGQPGTGQQNGASQSKGEQPNTGNRQVAPGQAKEQQPAQGKEAAKSNASEAGAGQKKNATANNGAGQPDKSKSPSDKSQNSGETKGERQGSASTEKNGSSPQEATQEDVARLKEALKDNKQQKQAADELSRVRAEARDPRVRKAAEDALKDASAQAEEAVRKASKEDVSKLSQALKSADQKQAAAEALSKIASEARDPDARKAAQDALKRADSASAKASPLEANNPNKSANGSQKGTGSAQAMGEKQRDPSGQSSAKRPGGAAGKTDSAKEANVEKGSGTASADAKSGKQGGAGGGSRTGDITDAQEKSQSQPANNEFARRGGVLQLEELKKKVTPDILKELKWTQKDWQEFQEQARRYETAQQKQQPLTPKDKLSSGSGVLSSTGPRQVRPNAGTRSDDTSTGRALPPPEFREAQNIFTSRPETPGPGKN